MSRFEIRNAATDETVEWAETYRDALGVAEHLSAKTKELHYVPMRVERTLEYAV